MSSDDVDFYKEYKLTVGFVYNSTDAIQGSKQMLYCDFT